MALEEYKPIFARDRLTVVVSSILLILASLAWITSYRSMASWMMSGSTTTMMRSGVAGVVSALSATSLSGFEILWTIGMVAMMFPPMIPIVLFYTKVAAKQEPHPSLARFVGVPLFLAGYLIIYSILGIVAYFGLYEATNNLSTNLGNFAFLSLVASSAVLVATGMYQLTSLKSRCLSNCVSPMGFFSLHYSRGLGGSVKMGLRHGIYCVGCCWAYMLVMLAVGAMSIPAMALLAGIIAFEKVLIRGAVWFSRFVAFVFISLGIASVFFPSILMLVL